MAKENLLLKVASFGIRFFFSAYLTFLILTLDNEIFPITVDSESLNVAQSAFGYLVSSIPFLTSFYLSVILFSPKERLVATNIQKEKMITTIHLFGTTFSIVYKIVRYESTSNLKGVLSYWDIALGSKSVVSLMGMQFLVINFITKRRKIVTALNLTIYFLTSVAGYGVCSLILN